MYIIRDIFHLKFGHYKDAKSLLKEASSKKLLPEQKGNRVFADFTGDSYRLIFEQSFSTLGDYENSLNKSRENEEWPDWYSKFKEHIEKSHREILKQIM